MRFLCLFVLVGFLSPTLRADDPPKTIGQLHLTFDKRSPLSMMIEQSKRLGFSLQALEKSQFEKDYDIANESFEAYIPDSYKPQGKWGLIVWISSGESGKPPPVFVSLLEQHKLLWIGANKAGNPRAYWCRIGLAVDGAENMKSRYSIDPNRIYVSGASGGGRSSSMAGVTYPDVFSGGLYIIGCNLYRDINVPAEHVKELQEKGEASPGPGQIIWRKSYAPPPLKLFTMAKKSSRHIILTGEHDQNRYQCKENFDAFKKDGFEHVVYFEAPGVGHSIPGVDWLEKSIAFLDEIPTTAKDVAGKDPIAAKAAGTSSVLADDPAADAELKAAVALAAKDPIAGHAALLEIARKHKQSTAAAEALKAADTLLANPANKKKIEDATEAARLLRVARLYVDNRSYSQARTRLDQILSDYPTTPSAIEAKALLKQIGKE
jgi:hypothetical protein